MQNPTTVSELFPSNWLKSSDLNGRTFTMAIQEVALETFYNKRKATDEKKIVLTFRKASKRMILNKTQSIDTKHATGIDAFLQWIGLSIQISPIVSNGKNTILIKAPPATAIPSPSATDEQTATTDPPPSDLMVGYLVLVESPTLEGLAVINSIEGSLIIVTAKSDSSIHHINENFISEVVEVVSEADVD